MSTILGNSDAQVLREMKQRSDKIAGDRSRDAKPAPIAPRGAQFIVVRLTAQDGNDFSKYAWQAETRSLQSADTTKYNYAAGSHLVGSLTDRPCYDLSQHGGSAQVGDHVVIMQVPVLDSAGNANLTWLIIGKENVEYIGYATGGSGGHYPPSFAYTLFFDSAMTRKVADNVGVWSAAPSRFMGVYANPGGGKCKYWWNNGTPEITQISESVVTQECPA